VKISIFGLGYVGCVSLGCLAQNGFEVIGIDVNKVKVDLINRGLPTIIEKDIDIIIKEQHKAGRIQATTDYMEAVSNSDVSIVCVGTPSTEKGHLNLDYIYETAKQIGEALKKKKSYHTVVIRSTVLPGTNFKVGEIIAQISNKVRNKDFSVVSNPEFLREGSAVQDYYNPPYTLIGFDDNKAIDILKELYSKVNGEFITVDIETAEIIKYVNNSFHALKVTFANEIGRICKKLNIDSYRVMQLFCLDTRLNISPYYFKPGFSYGGSCLPKDLKALTTIGLDYGLKLPVLESIEVSNHNHSASVIDLIINKNGKKVGILGIAFKEGTDDLRYSPILKVIEGLLDKGYTIKVYDPFVNKAYLMGSNKEYMQTVLPYLQDLMQDSEDEVINWADIIVFNRKSVNYEKLVSDNPGKSFIDLVRISEQLNNSNYEGICW
jgi:GDP-mannose 6-dehydrogenase